MLSTQWTTASSKQKILSSKDRSSAEEDLAIDPPSFAWPLKRKCFSRIGASCNEGEKDHSVARDITDSRR
jgi:hypothetical protein